MEIAAIARLLLRLAHALAAVVWLGGAVYYLFALRPRVREADAATRAVAGQAQRAYGQFATTATYVMLATGVVLMFDQLADGRGTIGYVLVLAVKIIAALVAFWLTGALARSRRPVRGATSSRYDRSVIALWLGTVALVLGVALSSIYPTGIGS